MKKSFFLFVVIFNLLIASALILSSIYNSSDEKPKQPIDETATLLQIVHGDSVTFTFTKPKSEPEVIYDGMMQPGVQGKTQIVASMIEKINQDGWEMIRSESPDKLGKRTMFFFKRRVVKRGDKPLQDSLAQ